jgi:hypothetical protein
MTGADTVTLRLAGSEHRWRTRALTRSSCQAKHVKLPPVVVAPLVIDGRRSQAKIVLVRVSARRRVAREVCDAGAERAVFTHRYVDLPKWKFSRARNSSTVPANAPPPVSTAVATFAPLADASSPAPAPTITPLITMRAIQTDRRPPCDGPVLFIVVSFRASRWSSDEEVRRRTPVRQDDPLCPHPALHITLIIGRARVLSGGDATVDVIPRSGIHRAGERIRTGAGQ